MWCWCFMSCKKNPAHCLMQHHVRVFAMTQKVIETLSNLQYNVHAPANALQSKVSHCDVWLLFTTQPDTSSAIQNSDAANYLLHKHVCVCHRCSRSSGVSDPELLEPAHTCCNDSQRWLQLMPCINTSYLKIRLIHPLFYLELCNMQGMRIGVIVPTLPCEE